MAYDERLAQRVREVIAERAECAEIQMFGGLCFMVNTHMAVGVTQHGLLLKVGSDLVEEAVARGGTRPMMGARVMTGVVQVDQSILDRDGLEAWVCPRVEAALALPPKPPKSRMPPKPRKPSKTAGAPRPPRTPTGSA